MSDQPITLGHLEQFFRSFARPDLDRILEERLAESHERGRAMYLRLVNGSVGFLESMYRFLRDDVRRLEQRLDEIHVEIARNDSRSVPPRIENARYKHEDSVAARARLVGYLARLGKEIERVEDGATKDALHVDALRLRHRVDELAAPLEIAGRRLDRYAQRIATGTRGEG